MIKASFGFVNLESIGIAKINTIFIIQIVQAMKRYVKLGFEVENGIDIENSIRDIAGIHVANLDTNRNTGIYFLFPDILVFC